jgi:HK97 gp10 family phage protein
MRKIEKDVIAKLEKEFDKFGLETVNDAKRLAPVDEGRLRNSINYDRKKLQVTINVNADYAPYIEFGTRKFATKYVSSLPQEWQVFAATFKGKASKGSFEEFVLRLTKWVKRKSIGASYNITTRRRNRVGKQTADTTANADAYAIALYILRNGIKPQPFLVPAFEKNKIKLIANLKTIL